jgi:hypothetical protein
MSQLSFTVEAQYAEGDRVVTRWSAGGTPTRRRSVADAPSHKDPKGAA